jgi:ubiquinone/menaquinone biosynthesis C-methylase UbiE
MEEPQIRFDDGAAYEDFMGKWSRLVGDLFLDWLAPPAGLRWVDVGCRNGAFTETIVARCAPLAVEGIDPSGAQLAFARARLAGRPVHFSLGGAMDLPYDDDAFDAAVMALVIFFVPEPAKGVAEMARVVKPGGSVSAYSWDFLDGGFPFAVFEEELAALGVPPLLPPSVEASRIESMQALWKQAGLVEVETRRIDGARTFSDFDTFWAIAQTGPPIVPRFALLPQGDVPRLKARLRDRLTAAADGSITYSATANAIRGKVAARP